MSDNPFGKWWIGREGYEYVPGQEEQGRRMPQPTAEPQELREPTAETRAAFDEAMTALRERAVKWHGHYLDRDITTDIAHLPPSVEPDGRVIELGCLLDWRESAGKIEFDEAVVSLDGLRPSPYFSLKDKGGGPSPTEWKLLELGVFGAMQLEGEGSPEAIWMEKLWRWLQAVRAGEPATDSARDLLAVVPYDVDTWIQYELARTYKETFIHVHIYENWLWDDPESKKEKVELFYPDNSGRDIYRYTHYGDGRETITFRRQRRIGLTGMQEDEDDRIAKEKVQADFAVANATHRAEFEAEKHEIDKPTDGSMRTMIAAINQALKTLALVERRDVNLDDRTN